MLRMYTDASTKSNPGPSGVGVILIGNGIHIQLSFPLEKEMSNHQAEFEAVLSGLNYLIANQLVHHELVIYSDSNIVVSAIERNYVKNPLFNEYLFSINKRLKLFPSFMIQWISETQNKEADHFARQALYKRLKSDYSIKKTTKKED
ncbi:ribonuclease HI family protein [Carnobacterium sp. TMP28]|uniref:ribonuclease HI family protein n=1 Tax=Carnobacterium sp. TMP28 TaxID=3397060 RepID=UPI0039E0071D